MCGIAGIVGAEDVTEMLISSLNRLEYRGYDSCGIAILDGKKPIALRKNVGDVHTVNEKEHFSQMQGSCGIAHTRWATHGMVSVSNAHPHTALNGDLCVAHNGIITNHRLLRQQLEQQGIQFASETDSEVIGHLIGQCFVQSGDMESALLETTQKLEGAYAFCVLHRALPQQIYCVRSGSPLVLGLGEHCQYVASDTNALLSFTHDMLIFQDGEYAILTPDQIQLKKLAQKQPITRKPMRIDWDVSTTGKSGYSHYMLKEIFEQPQTIQTSISIAPSIIRGVAETILSASHTWLCGIGTTYYVALWGQYMFAEYAKHLMQAVSSDEFSEVGILKPNDLFIAISQSGETYDTRLSMEKAKQQEARSVGIVNMMGSSISLLADQLIMQQAGPEMSVVSTKAALSQMIILKRLALETARLAEPTHQNTETLNNLQNNLNIFPELLSRVINELSGQVRSFAINCLEQSNWLILGRGSYYPIALEIALKVKEITYLHVEGMPAGFLKHGALALIAPEMRVLFLIPAPTQKRIHQQTLSAVAEVKARGGTVCGMVREDDQEAIALLPQCIVLPKEIPASLMPLLQLVMGQLLAYFSALELGCPIDKPRNLAKSVTVE